MDPHGATRIPGDWNCITCGDFQFARNHKCRTCGGFKPLRGEREWMEDIQRYGFQGDWVCQHCDRANHGGRTDCYFCGRPCPGDMGRGPQEDHRDQGTSPSQGDWACQHCSGTNHTGRTDCYSCGRIRRGDMGWGPPENRRDQGTSPPPPQPEQEQRRPEEGAERRHHEGAAPQQAQPQAPPQEPQPQSNAGNQCEPQPVQPQSNAGNHCEPQPAQGNRDAGSAWDEPELAGESMGGWVVCPLGAAPKSMACPQGLPQGKPKSGEQGAAAVGHRGFAERAPHTSPTSPNPEGDNGEIQPDWGA